MQHIHGIPVFGDPIDTQALTQIYNCAREAQYVALMADHHKGYNMPIGGVAAYKDQVSPAGVGFDIGCGNKAVRLEATLEDIQPNLAGLADAIYAQLSFGVGQNNDERVDHELFDDEAWKLPLFRGDKGIKERARNQLGTIGSGNHYVDVFVDELERVWVGVHFGSRGLGHRIASEFIRLAGANPNGNMDEPPALLPLASPAGEDYLVGMELAGRYAYAGRDWVCQTVASLIGAPIVEEVHNHHNFAWKENHFGEDLWVVRKGATPAFAGQKGFVGGSMADCSVILEGIACKEATAALSSTVHGAGRVMSRTQAAGKAIWVRGQKIRKSNGLVDMDNVRTRMIRNGIQLRGSGADEAPEVYKRLDQVLAQHKESIKVLHRLKPLIVCMAGEDIADPYKD